MLDAIFTLELLNKTMLASKLDFESFVEAEHIFMILIKPETYVSQDH